MSGEKALMLNGEKNGRHSCASLAKTHSGFCIFVQLFSNRCSWPTCPAACLFVVLLMFYSKIQTLTDSLRRVSPSAKEIRELSSRCLESLLVVTNVHGQSGAPSSKIISFSLLLSLGHQTLGSGRNSKQRKPEQIQGQHGVNWPFKVNCHNFVWKQKKNSHLENSTKIFEKLITCVLKTNHFSYSFNKAMSGLSFQTN